MKTNPLLKKY